MFVRDIMTRNPVTVSPQATLRELLSLMTARTFEAIPVCESGSVVGMVTDWDIVTNAPSIEGVNWLQARKVQDVMTPNVVCVSEEEIVEMAAYHMFFHDLDALPVVDDQGQLTGIVTQNDVFRTFVSFMGLRTKGTRITIEAPDEPGVLAGITRLVHDAGLSIASLSTYIPPGSPSATVILRVRSSDVQELIARLGREGFRTVHVSEAWT